jgi:disulfide bond formation protein DsbB
MIYWLILIVYGIGTGGFTVTTHVMHVGNFSDLKSCQAVAKDSQNNISPDNWRFNYICVQASDGKAPPPP